MLKILMWLCFFIVLIGLWKVWFKIHIHRHFQQNRNKQQEDVNKPSATSIGEIPLFAEARIEEVEEYEQQLFDDVCQIFFKQKYGTLCLLARVFKFFLVCQEFW